MKEAGLISFDGCNVDTTGGAMDFHAGSFTVKESGIYMFTFSAKFGVKITSGEQKGAWVDIFVDDKVNKLAQGQGFEV